MTVCVAAIGEGGGALSLASDRMITALAQYQAPDPKVFTLTTSIVVMWAGEDASFQSLIHNRLREDINSRIASAPTDWLSVGEVASLYQKYYNQMRRARMEQAVLEPFGLDSAAFINTQATLSPDFARHLREGISSYHAPTLSALVVGFDLRGTVDNQGSQVPTAHIYRLQGWGQSLTLSCEDAIGFAAIGSGDVHAESALMKAGHGPSRSLAETVFATYVAKKRGQAGGGVGDLTDLFFFIPRSGLPSYIARVDDDIREFLDQKYEDLTKAEENAVWAAQDALTRWLAQRRTQPPAGQANAPIGVAQLTYNQQPSTNANVGVPFAQAPVLLLRDAANNPMGGVVVSATITGAPAGMKLIGATTSVTNASGVATFAGSGLGLFGPAGNYTLTFTAGALTSAASNTIALGAGPLPHL